MVQTVTALEQRRQQASVVYLSLVSAGIAGLGFVQNLDPIFVAIPITLICVLWIFSLANFRALSQSKFDVIASIENDWDFKPFEAEWNSFKDKKSSNISLFIGLTHIEICIPVFIAIFSVGYTVFRTSGLLYMIGVGA